MGITICEEIVHIAGMFIGVLIVRYLMKLSSPKEDLYMLRHFYYGLVVAWRSGQFEQVRHAHIARKLLDY